MSAGRDAYLAHLRALFAEMDAAYARAAAAAGFECRGCRDSCCRSLFHHHTHLEAIYLREGFGALPQAEREAILARARAAAAVQGLPDGERRPMCPLNAAGRCRLYMHRPMICRLHGIAHELHPPGRPLVIGAGCAEYERARGAARQGQRFDRTPLYARMAALESEFRESEGLRNRVKLTIAEILLAEEAAP